MIVYATEEELTAKLRAMLSAREEWVSPRTLSERYDLQPQSINNRIRGWRKQGVLVPGEDMELESDGRLRTVRLTPFLREQFGKMKRCPQRGLRRGPK